VRRRDDPQAVEHPIRPQLAVRLVQEPQVVAVLGSVDLGPRAIVRGDVVTVGGRLRRAAGSQIEGAVTEYPLPDESFPENLLSSGGRILRDQ